MLPSATNALHLFDWVKKQNIVINKKAEINRYKFKFQHLFIVIVLITIVFFVFGKVKDTNYTKSSESPLILSGVEGPIEDLTIGERFTVEIPGIYTQDTIIDAQIKSKEYGLWKNLFGYEKTFINWDELDTEGLGKKFHFAGSEFSPGNYTIVGIKSQDQNEFIPVNVDFIVHETKPSVSKVKLQAQQASADEKCLTGGTPIAITICIPEAQIVSGNFSVTNSFTVSVIAPTINRTSRLKLTADANEIKTCEQGQSTCSSQIEASQWAGGSSHTIEARIRTNSQTLSKFTVTVKKANESPRGPSDSKNPELYIDGVKDGGTTGKTFELTANASDQSGISKIEFRIDNATTNHHACNPGNSKPRELSCKASFTLSRGQHTVHATATDASNKKNKITKTRTVTVDPTKNTGSGESIPPTLNFTGPTNNSTVSAKVTIEASASDASGVKRIKMVVDNQAEPFKQCENNTQPSTLQCKGTITLNPGLHTISVTAVDGSNRANQNSKSRTFTVSNTSTNTPPQNNSGNSNCSTLNRLLKKCKNKPSSTVKQLSSGPLNTYQKLTAKTLDSYAKLAINQSFSAKEISPIYQNKKSALIKTAQAQTEINLGDMLGDGRFGAIHLGNGIFLTPPDSDLSSQLFDIDKYAGDDGFGASGFQMSFSGITELYNYDPTDEFFSFLASYGLFNPATGIFSPQIQQLGILIGEPDAMAHEFVHRSFDLIPEFKTFTEAVWGNLTKAEQSALLFSLMNAGYEGSAASQFSNLTEFMAFLFESTGMTYEQTVTFFSGEAAVYEDGESIVFQTEFGLISFSKQKREFDFVLRDAAGNIVFATTLSFSGFNQILTRNYGGKFEVNKGWAIMINSENKIMAIFPPATANIPGLPRGEALYNPTLYVGDPNNPDDDYIEGRLSNGDQLRIRPGATILITISRNHSTGEMFVEINGFKFGSNDGRIINTNDGWGGNNPYDASNPNPCSYPSFQNTPQCGGGNGTGSGGSGSSPNNSCGAGMSALDCALLNNQN